MFEVITQSKYCAQKVLKNTDPNKRTYTCCLDCNIREYKAKGKLIVCCRGFDKDCLAWKHM